MPDYARLLGKAVRKARIALNLTQLKVADIIGSTERTIITIEAGNGNPKLDTLYPLIRLLRIDARMIFNPELEQESEAKHRLQCLVSECDDQEAKAVVPVMEAVLDALRSSRSTDV